MIVTLVTSWGPIVNCSEVHPGPATSPRETLARDVFRVLDIILQLETGDVAVVPSQQKATLRGLCLCQHSLPNHYC